MLALQKSKAHQGTCTPNVLPCRINHNGPVDASKRYWNSSMRGMLLVLLVEQHTDMDRIDGKTTAYFRGRKLHGRELKVPKGYKGVVMSKTERVLPRGKTDGVEEDDEEEKVEEVKIIEEVGAWDGIIVWGHEALMDEADPYVRSVEEWMGFSAAVSLYDY